MIDITIKTLDSRNHVFSVEDELTVRQLKERIAEPVNVPVESQRLIYCGRVLVDEKKLSEYDVHGKVIHLVQRAPPTDGSGGPGAAGTSSAGGGSDGGGRGGAAPGSGTAGAPGGGGRRAGSGGAGGGPFRTFISPGQVDGSNAMYLGAMAFPAELMDAQGISMPQPRHRLSQSRLSVARGMLRRARYTLLNLENPSSLSAAAAADLNNGNIPNLDEVPVDLGGGPGEDLGVDMSGASTSNVGVQHPPHVSLQGGGGGGGTGVEMQADDSEPPSDRNSPEESALSDEANHQGEGGGGGGGGGTEPTGGTARGGAAAGGEATGGEATGGGGGGATGGPGSRYRFPGPVHMAEIIFMLRDVERRFAPFLDRFYDLVRQDPVLENPTEAQRLFELVSKLMHYLSHAYHAMSDIMCDFSLPPPRRLRCRPVLIQHSAVLQTGIPIQAQLNVGGTTNVSFTSSSSGSPPANNNNTSATPATTDGTATGNNTATPPSVDFGTEESAESGVRPPPGVTGAGHQQQQQSASSATHDTTATSQTGTSASLESGVEGGLPTPPAGGGTDFEVFMDVGQGSITIDSGTIEATLFANPTPSSDSAGGGGGGSWHSHPEFLQRISQLIARFENHTEEAFGGGTTSAGGTRGRSNSTGGSGVSNINPWRIGVRPGGAPGEGGSAPVAPGGGGATASVPPPAAGPGSTNSQATQPTTSTQTRSTVRPHDHISQAFQGFFDPFLPCNSHHIHGSRRRRAEASVEISLNNNPTAAGTVPASNGGSGAGAGGPAGGPSQSQGTSTEQPSSARPSPAASFPGASGSLEPPPSFLNLFSNLFSGLRSGGGPVLTGPMLSGPILSGPTLAAAAAAASGGGAAGVGPTVSGGGGGGGPSPLSGSVLTGTAVEPSLIRILPRVVTVFLQGSPPLQNVNLSRDTTVAELLHSLPDHSYTERASLFGDFVMTLARNLRVVDVLNLGSGDSNLLLSLRPALIDFVRHRLLEGRLGSQSIAEAVGRINAELRPLVESILSQEDIPFREDIDIMATVNQLNQTTFPTLIRDILEEDNNTYARNLPQHCNDYAQHLASILYHCCHNGQQGLEAIYTILARRVIVGVPSVLQNWSVGQIVAQLRAMTSGLETSRDAIQPFLVYRMPGAAPPDTVLPDQPQAMETESVSGGEGGSLVGEEGESDTMVSPPVTPPEVSVGAGVAASLPLTAAAPDCATAPPVVAQQNGGTVVPTPLPPHRAAAPPAATAPPHRAAAPPPVATAPPHRLPAAPADLAWQAAVPPDWVPIMRTDRERQRRGAVQGAFSDAYLAGMPTKRRKMIQSAKPPTNLSRVISESMKTALEGAGLTEDQQPGGLAESAGGDEGLRSAYREQVRYTLSPSLSAHPDFTPEKYPAAAKLFSNK